MKTTWNQVTMATRPMNIVHLVRSLELGGLERLVCQLAIQRHRRAHERCRTSILCLDQLGPLADVASQHGVFVQLVGMQGGRFQTMGRLCAALRQAEVDILHCHNLTALTYGGVAAAACRLPGSVFTKHGTHLPKFGWGNRFRRMLAGPMQLVGVTAEVQQLLRQWVPRNRRPVACVPNGIDLTVIDAAQPGHLVRKKHGWCQCDPLIGTVARLSPEKDFQSLLRAFRRLREEAAGARLVIVGEGPSRPQIEDAVKSMALHDSVELTGARQDVPDLLRAFDVFVLSSWTEGLPIALLEAMAAGLPIAATAVGGVPDVLDQGKCGLLAPAGEPTAMLHLLMQLVREHDLRQQLGRAARAKIERRHTVARTAEQYEQLYQQLAYPRAA